MPIKVFHLLNFCLQASLNREIQAETHSAVFIEIIASSASSAVLNQGITATTLHQSSIVRWLSVTDLLESIKGSYDAL